jgi:N,N'-diacetyllegionaminate synthase
MIKEDGSVYLIAEIGGNHEGDFEKAKELLIDAASSGADAVKFQIYKGDTLVNKKIDPERVKHFDRFALTTDQYLELAEMCKKRNVDFLASVWDINLIELFADTMPFYKVGSGDLTAYPILKKIAAIGKPILLSTGLAKMKEVLATVDYICSCNPIYRNKNKLGLLQCTSMYPIPDSDANLKVITEFQKIFPDIVIGYSDHTEGTYAAEIAVALGAQILEVHFTNDKENRSFRDHKVSFTSYEIKALLPKLRQIRLLLGDGAKEPLKSEVESGHLGSFRRGLYARVDIYRGQLMRNDDVIALRPNQGVSANIIEKIINMRTESELHKNYSIPIFGHLEEKEETHSK